jgi:Flp pilus assembly protein TadG
VAIVEFALVMPLLCLVVVLMLDFGRAFNYWIDTTHLASEGARLAAVDHVPASGTLQAYIRSKADTAELRNGTSRWINAPLQVCVSNPGTTSKVGDPVEVSVSTTYHFLPILNAGTIELQGSATMRREVLANHVSSGCG